MSSLYERLHAEATVDTTVDLLCDNVIGGDRISPLSEKLDRVALAIKKEISDQGMG